MKRLLFALLLCAALAVPAAASANYTATTNFAGDCHGYVSWFFNTSTHRVQVASVSTYCSKYQRKSYLAAAGIQVYNGTGWSQIAVANTGTVAGNCGSGDPLMGVGLTGNPTAPYTSGLFYRVVGAHTVGDGCSPLAAADGSTSGGKYNTTGIAGAP
jgi:hypothetical protein